MKLVVNITDQYLLNKYTRSQIWNMDELAKKLDNPQKFHDEAA
jgi:hypothetical protein